MRRGFCFVEFLLLLSVIEQGVYSPRVSDLVKSLHLLTLRAFLAGTFLRKPVGVAYFFYA